MKEYIITKLTELLIKTDIEEKNNKCTILIKKKDAYRDLIKLIKDLFEDDEWGVITMQGQEFNNENDSQNCTITIRMSSELKDKMKRIAKAQKKKYQTLIKDILESYYNVYTKNLEKENKLRDMYRKK